MKIEQKRLNNNLETTFINAPGAGAASVQIWFRAGSALEKQGNQGIAHFLEHMFFKGTTKRPGHQLARDIESYGGEVNAFTSFDYTCYYINTPNSHLAESVDILMDMVSNPLFDNRELTPEREVVFEEYRRSLDDPNHYNFHQIQHSAFTDGYRHPILGSEKTIKNFSREDLIEYRKQFYNLSNAMLVVAGDLQQQQDKITKTIEAHQMPHGPTSNFPKFKLNNKAQTNIHHKDTRQVTLTMVIQAPAYDDEQAASEDLAISALGHGETSRLYKKMVTQSSNASSVGGSTMYFANGGVHFIRFACPQNTLTKSLDEFTQIIIDSLKEQFSTSEITKIKNQHIASKIYEKETVESFAFSLGHGFAQNGDIHCEDEFIKRVKSTSTRSTSQALANIFSRDLHITVQTPREMDHNSIPTLLEKLRSKIRKQAQKSKENDKKNITQKSAYDTAVSTIRLKSGITLIYRQNKLSPTFTLQCYLKGGLAYENQKNNGIYHLLAKTLTYGHQKTKYEQLKEQLENQSAYLGGFSGKNAYGLSMHGQTEFFNTHIQDFFNTLITPKLPNNYINLEKKLLIRMIENKQEDPLKHCFKQVNQLLFASHPYARDLIGTIDTIRSLKRTDLNSLHQKNLRAKEMVLTYCGDLELDDILEQIRPFIEGLKARPTVKARKTKAKPLKKDKVWVDFEREQTHIFIGKQAYGIQDREDIFLKVLTSYLSGQSSELFVEVRDRQGLCYAVQPLHHSALETGYWGIYIGAGHDKVSAAITSIEGILTRLKDQGLAKDEFERVKNMIEGQELLSLQTNEDYANFYSIPILHGLGLDYSHKINRKITQLEHQQFNHFLAKFLDKGWKKVFVGKKP